MLVFLCVHWTGLTLTVPLFSPTGSSISIPTRGVPSTACIPAKQRVPFPCGIVKKNHDRPDSRKRKKKTHYFPPYQSKFIRTSSRGDSKNLKITYFIAIDSHPLPCIGHTERWHRCNCVTMCDLFFKKGVDFLVTELYIASVEESTAE